MPSFNIIRLDQTGESIVMRGENPLIFDNGADAQQCANQYIQVTGLKHHPRPIKENIDWRARERERFASGHYTKLPWHNKAWVSKVKECADHFAHVSKNDPTRLAFTVNAEKAILDLKTQIRPSKYLANFYSKELNEDAIRTLVAEYKKIHDKENCVSFAFTAKDIERIYRRGPSSCMSYPRDRYRTKIHPVSVYEGPDLAVAYVERNGRIIARCLVWPEKKIFSRIYGDDYLLDQLLREEGYCQGKLNGARFTKVKEGNRYVCPFIDGVRHVKIGRKWIYIDPEGKRFAGNTDGFCGQGFRCAFCATEQDAQKVEVRQVNGGNACLPCFESRLALGTIAQCVMSNGYFNVADLRTMFNGQLWHRNYIDLRHAFRCDTCDQYFPIMGHNYLMPRRTFNDPYRCRDCGIPQRELPF